MSQYGKPTGFLHSLFWSRQKLEGIKPRLGRNRECRLYVQVAFLRLSCTKYAGTLQLVERSDRAQHAMLYQDLASLVQSAKVKDWPLSEVTSASQSGKITRIAR